MKLREFILLLRDVEAALGPDADVRVGQGPAHDRTTLAAHLTVSGDAVVIAPVPTAVRA